MSGRRPDPAQGVFETLLLHDGRVQALEAHLQRLEHSTRELYGMAVRDAARARLVDTLTRAAQTPGEQRARIDAAPRTGELDLRLTIRPGPTRAPVTLTPLVIPGGLGAHKWQDRRLIEPGTDTAAPLAADTAAPLADPAVPLIVDADGSVLEAGWANVWILDGDELVTPPLDGRLLPGVTRARLLALAPRLGLRPREAPLTLADARAASTLFLTSSLRLAVPASFGRQGRDSLAVDRIRSALTAA